MMAFAWLNWIIFTVITGFLLVIIAKLWSRQSSIKWTAPVKQLYFASRGEVEQFSDPSIPEKSTSTSSAEP
jgi:hypothetical protein